MKIHLDILDFFIRVSFNDGGWVYITLGFEELANTYLMADFNLGYIHKHDLPKTKEDCLYIMGYFWTTRQNRAHTIFAQGKGDAFWRKIKDIPEFKEGEWDWFYDQKEKK